MSQALKTYSKGRPFIMCGISSRPARLSPIHFSCFSLTDHCPLISAHYCLKSFSCNTYESPRKCCKQKTYGLAKPFRCNPCKKQGSTSVKPKALLATPLS